jgi:hypothetical protein
MGQHWNDGGYSSEVELYLQIAEKTLPIARIGPNSFTLRDSCEYPPGTEATIVVKVDGRERKVHAFLQNGVLNGLKEVHYI